MGKEFMRASEFIIEYETRSLLYHGVRDGKTFSQILKSGKIETAEGFEFDTDQERKRGETPKPRISLSRNQYLRYGNAVAQFVIDKNALIKSGYKVNPVVGFNMPHKAETEEQVFNDIPVKLPFVVEIQYDPNIDIPKDIINHVTELGIKITPWRKEKERADSILPKIVKTKDKFDPSKVEVSNWNFSGKKQWYITYKVSDERSMSIGSPSYNEKFIRDLAEKIKDRMSKQLSWEDLFPKQKYTKNWDQGRRIAYHGTPEYDSVNEAPLPADWDPEKMNLRQTFKNRLKYALDRAKRLGGGSSRVAMTIDYEGRPTALKVAKNLKGLAQNEAEIEILEDFYVGRLPIVIPLIDYDKANKRPVWLQTEIAKKVRGDTLLKLLHAPNMWLLTNQVRNIAGKKLPHDMDDERIKGFYFQTKPAVNPLFNPSNEWKPTKQDWNIFRQYCEELAELVMSSTLEIGDLSNPANWGVYNNRPVVIDLGFTEETAPLYGYNRK